MVPFALASLVLPAAFVSSSGAATPPPPTPQSSVNCSGALTAAPTSEEPNLLGYKFSCAGRISAYTLIVNRRRRDVETIDDFSTSADVLSPNGAIDPNHSFTCEGSLPGDSVNCNAGAGAQIGWGSFAVGQIDLVDPYCANYPKSTSKKKKGSKKKPVTATPEPQAFVQLIVTNLTGAQDGPFRLPRSPHCPKLKKKGKH
jgi:hypothetical protein